MYEAIYNFVQEQLVQGGGEDCPMGKYPFRKRSEHIWRVFLWAQRLTEAMEQINKEAVLVAALFHDVGYATGKENHAQSGAKICRNYLMKNGFETCFADLVTFLVENHSKKVMLEDPNSPLELILLMEADLLDETGALSIVWDCLAKGLEQSASFEETYEHINNYSVKHMAGNPMVTEKARRYWEEKNKLTEEFVQQLSFDLGL